MNDLEVNVFLTKAALLDPRMKRLDPVEQADMAEMWATALPDVSLSDALEALRAHYRAETAAIMPAHVLRIVGADERPDPYGDWRDTTVEVLAESKARALAAAGVSDAEYEARKTDVAWVRAKFGRLQLEGGDLG